MVYFPTMGNERLIAGGQIDVINARQEGVVKVEGPTANFTIIYGVHIATEDPNRIPSDIDGLVIEAGWPYPVTYGDFQRIRYHNQYVDLFTKAEREGFPIIQADVKLKNVVLTTAADGAVVVPEFAVGFSLLYSAWNALQRDHSRREFITASAKAGLGTYLSLPTAAFTFRWMSSLAGVFEDQSRELAKLADKSHPEAFLFLLKLRNAIIAYKAQSFYKFSENPSQRQHLAIVIGAEHVGIEDRLKDSPSVNLDYIKTLLPLIKFMFDLDTFSTAARYQYAKNSEGTSDWTFTKLNYPELIALSS